MFWSLGRGFVYMNVRMCAISLKIYDPVWDTHMNVIAYNCGQGLRYLCKLWLSSWKFI